MMVNQKASSLDGAAYFCRIPPVSRAEKTLGGGFIMFYPVMLIIWGVLALIAAALFLYRTSLTRDEDDQIYLDDAFQHEKAAQEAIIAKVNKVEPALRISLWAVGTVSVILVVVYFWSLIAEFVK
jgi:1,4-dihydroxy-2-naphthoate octaprenyltransferase